MHQKIGVDSLAVGMYVAQLDRPWLETPFLFQGFYIRDEAEIAELQAHCRHVYVDADTLPEQDPPGVHSGSVTESNGNGTAARSSAAAPLRGAPAVQKSAHALGRTGSYYTDVSGLRDEIRTATRVQEQAVATVQRVMDDLRRSGNLDLRRLESVVTPMVDSVLRNPAAMSCLARIRSKNDYLYQHCLATSVWAAVLGRHIGLDREALDSVALGAMVLDVGMTRVPDEVLKKPGRLTEAEQRIVRRHIEYGLDILDEAGQCDSRVLQMVENHHERYNGTGYARGLSGHDIPVFGRIAGIVDSYDAMISKRSYADPIPSYDALRNLQKLADVEFQAEIVDQFTQAIGAFPTGTLVELNTGEVGVVTAQNRIRRLRPEVMLITDAEKHLLEQFRLVDLNEQTVTADGGQSLWIERGLQPGAYGIDPAEFYIN